MDNVIETPRQQGVDVRRVRVGCEFVHLAAVDTPTVLQVEPRDAAPICLAWQEWSMEPQSRLRRYRDLYGNPCTRVVLPAGRSALRYDAVVLVADAAEDADEHARELPPDDLPDEVLLYTLPSRYCLPDMLGDEAWSRFGGMPRGYPRVRDLRPRPRSPDLQLRQQRSLVDGRGRQHLRVRRVP